MHWLVDQAAAQSSLLKITCYMTTLRCPALSCNFANLNTAIRLCENWLA